MTPFISQDQLGVRLVSPSRAWHFEGTPANVIALLPLASFCSPRQTFMARFRGYPATVGCVTLFQFTMQQPTPGTTLLGFQLSLVQIYKLRYEAKRGEDGHKTSKVDRSIESKYNLLKAWNTQKGIQIANDVSRSLSFARCAAECVFSQPVCAVC